MPLFVYVCVCVCVCVCIYIEYYFWECLSSSVARKHEIFVVLILLNNMGYSHNPFVGIKDFFVYMILGWICYLVKMNSFIISPVPV